LQTIATEPLLIMNTANSSKAIDFNVRSRIFVNIKLVIIRDFFN
jgi:hypothetical protein